MSGPKTSRYTLTPEQRRILAEQRRLERRRAVAKEKIKKYQKDISAISAELTSKKKIVSEVMTRSGKDSGASELVSEFEAVISKARSAIKDANYDDVDSVEAAAKTAQECFERAKKLAPKMVESSEKARTELEASLQRSIDKGFSFSFADIREIKTDNNGAIRENAVGQLEAMLESDFLPSAIRDEIREAISRIEMISDGSFLKNFVSLSVNPLIKKVRAFTMEYEECREEFDGAYTEYTALCNLYGYVSQEFQCSRESVNLINSEICRIKSEISHDDEQAYISDCLDEIMAEMGYTVLGERSVVKRSGKRFRNELYSYGSGTAVNVTYSDDGKIAMELGGIATCDRMPTPEEREELCECMESFCGDFKEIEKRLLARGIAVSDRISILPPGEEYAQIINVADYDTQVEAEPLSVKTTKHKLGRKRNSLRKGVE